MKLLLSVLRTATAPILIAICVLAGATAWRDTPSVRGIEGRILDALFLLRGERTPSSDTLVIAIDDQSVAEHGGWPIDRAVLAHLVDTLDQVGAAAIGLDLLLLERRPANDGSLAAGDRALLDAIAATDRVVLPFAITAPDPGTSSSDQTIRRSAYPTYLMAEVGQEAIAEKHGLLLPFPELAEVAGVGHVSVPVEPDGAVRHWRPVAGIEDRRYPAMATELVRLFRNIPRSDVIWIERTGLLFGNQLTPTNVRNQLALNAYGPGGSFRTISLADFLSGRTPAHIARNRIVLIGATATGVGGGYMTPFDHALSGVELIATMTQNLLHGDSLIQGPETHAISMISLVLFTVLTAALIAIRLPGMLFAGMLGMVALWAFTLYAAFTWFGFWLDATPTLAAIVLTGLWVLATRSIGDRRAKLAAQNRSRALSRFVAPALVEQLARRDAALTGSHERTAAVMFIDLVGFTKASEDLKAVDTLPFLSQFYHMVEAATDAHHGIVDKFIGDGAMALFGVEADNPGMVAADALQCALRLVDDFDAMDRQAWVLADRPISMSIGLHFGPVALAEIGGRRQVQFTATGDTVNVASRIEGLTRDLGTRVIVSDDTVAAARGLLPAGVLDRFTALPPQAVRGRTRTLSVWALKQDRTNSHSVAA